MATTKAFELAQLSALTTVDASGNVTTNTSQIANASGDLILDSAADIVLNADGADIILADDTVDFGRFKRDNGHLVIKSETIDKSVIIKGTTTSNAVVTALTFDMANSGRATFSENVIIAGTLTGVTDFNSSGDMSVGGDLTVTGDLTVEGTQVTLNTTALDVEDKNITLNYHASNDTSASADGAGITIQDAVDASNDASILWNATNDAFDFSHEITAPSALTLTSNAPRIFLYEADTTDLNTALFSSGGAFTIRTTTDDDSTRTTRLQVSHSTGDITFYDTAGDPGMVWDASEGSDGALLIGGHTALRSGSVAGRNDAQLSLESTNFHNASFVANQDNSNGYHLIIGKSRGTNNVATVGGVDIVEPLDEIGSLVFAAADGTDLRPKVAQISAYVPAGTTPAVNAVSGELRFGTTSHAQDVTNHMVLDKDGKVGIGILTPETLLHVQKSSSALYTSSMSGVSSYTPSGADMIQVRNSNTGVNDIYAGIWFETGTGATNTTGTDRSGRIALVVDNDNPYSSNFVFQTRGSAGTLTEKMRISGSGNVDVHNKLGVNIDSDSTAIFRAGWANSGVTRPSTLYSAMIETNSDQDGLGLFTTDDRNVRIIFGSPTNNVGGQIVYYTDTSTPHMKFFTRGSEVMALKEGKVGIGTDDPAVSLHIGDGTTDEFVILDKGTSNTSGILFRNGGNNKVKLQVNSSEEFEIHTNNTRKARITESGSVYSYNNQPTIRPSLSLDFINGGEILDHRVIYHRTGTGTRVNKNGHIEYMKPGLPRFDYDPITNEPKGLLIERQSYNDMAGNSGSVSYVPTLPHMWNIACSKQQYADIAPDGTMSACLMRTTSSNDRTTASGTLSKTGYATWSVFMKVPSVNPVTTTTLLLYNNSTSSSLVSKTITWNDPPTASSGLTITAFKNDWYRFSMVTPNQVTAGHTLTGYVYISGSGQYNQKGVLVWGGQIEPLGTIISDSSSTTSFIPNEFEFGYRTSAATYQDENGLLRLAGPNQPRYGYKYHAASKSFLPTGLFAEQVSMNRAPNTNMGLASAGWSSGQNITVTDYEAISPDGTKTASKFTPNNITSTHSTYKLVNASSGTTCSSIFVKANGITTGAMYVDTSGGHSGYLHFDMTNGNYVYSGSATGVITLEAYGVEDYGNGWYRPWIALKATNGAYYTHVNSTASFNGATSHTPNGTDSFYAWGHQLEDRAAPTSFIYTQEGAAVTRAGDYLSSRKHERGQDIAYLDLHKNNWFNFENGGEGTVLADFEGIAPSGGTGGRVFGIIGKPSEAGADRIDYVMSTSSFQPYVARDSVVQASYINENIETGHHATALSFGTDHFRTVVDGYSLQVDPNTADMPDITTHGYFSIGHNTILGQNDTHARFRKIAYYPVQLSDDEKKAITEID